MSQEISVIHFRVGQEPEQVSVPNELSSFQKLVAGYIEAVPLGAGLMLICNEDGMSLNLPPNRRVHGLMILGDFFICRIGSEEFASVQVGDLEEVNAGPPLPV
jgi:hypothetical protein